eukprot:5772638-Amphidinium_carterae.1
MLTASVCRDVGVGFCTAREGCTSNQHGNDDSPAIAKDVSLVSEHQSISRNSQRERGTCTFRGVNRKTCKRDRLS